MNNTRYSLSWSDGNGRIIWNTWSFNCIADAKDYAAANAPAGASRYTITNIASRDCIEHELGS